MEFREKVHSVGSVTPLAFVRWNDCNERRFSFPAEDAFGGLRTTPSSFGGGVLGFRNSNGMGEMVRRLDSSFRRLSETNSIKLSPAPKSDRSQNVKTSPDRSYVAKI